MVRETTRERDREGKRWMEALWASEQASGMKGVRNVTDRIKQGTCKTKGRKRQK